MGLSGFSCYKVCYVFDCKIENLLEYKAPAVSGTEDKAGEGKIVEEKMRKIQCV